MEIGWLCILPPLVAITLAIATRRVVLSLLLGVFAGAVLVDVQARTDWSVVGVAAVPFAALGRLLEDHLWTSLAEGDHIRVFAMTLLLGAMIGVIHRNGGMHGIVDKLSPLARSRRGGQLTTWILGLVVFIDDYANSLLLGHTMRPLTDRLRISREKLAFLVDCTAAPVSGLAVISTWVAGEIGYIESGYKEVGITDISGLTVFMETIPYRFYVLWALLFVPLVAWLGRDFGPMWTAEQKAAAGELPDDILDAASNRDSHHDSVSGWWVNAVVPIVLTVVVTVVLLAATGLGSEDVQETAATGLSYWIAVFGNGNAYLALVYAALAGLLSAVVLTWSQRIMSLADIRAAAFQGALVVLPALTILWLAWALSDITGKENLKTGIYVGQVLQQQGSWLSPAWMPSVVFLLASLVAFSTGTSWGTMGILIPIVVATTYQMMGGVEAGVEPRDPVLVATIGSVLAGAIFGDHCSPISDTTILSSQASGCDVMAHVRTQLPYALLVAAVSLVCGTIPLAFGIPVWVLVPGGVIVMAVVLRLVGRRVG